MENTKVDTKRRHIGKLSNHIKIGLIGMPNSGKTSLYNALLPPNRRTALVGDYLFTTIDNNICAFEAVDERFDWLVEVTNPLKVSKAKITLFDSAGLVKGSFLEVFLLENVDNASINNNVCRKRELELLQWKL